MSVMASIDDILRSAAEVLRSFGAAEIFAFGSAAEGRMGPGSDIDLAVTGIPPRLFFRAAAAAEDATGCQIDLVDLDEGTPFTQFLRNRGGLKRVA